jgi:hypothetical protein
MITNIFNLTLAHNNDLIGILDRGKTLCDDDLCRFRNKALKAFTDLRISLRINS